MKNLPPARSATFIVFPWNQLCFERQTICILFIRHFQYFISQMVSPVSSPSSRRSLRRAAGLPQCSWLKENVHPHLTGQNGTTLYMCLSTPLPIPLNRSSHASNWFYQSSPRGHAFSVTHYPWSFEASRLEPIPSATHLTPQHFDLRNSSSPIIGF